MTEPHAPFFVSVLDPIERISETLFGIIMALTFISSLGIATGGDIEVRTILFGALGMNLAWGIVDGGLYLLGRISQRGGRMLTLRRLKQAKGSEAARRIAGDALSPELVALIPDERLVAMTQSLRNATDLDRHPGLTKEDWRGACGICLLSFFATFPLVIPFIFMRDARSALHASYGVAIAMLFFCGYAFGRRSGLRPLMAGSAMVAAGSALVGVVVALGG